MLSAHVGSSQNHVSAVTPIANEQQSGRTTCVDDALCARRNSRVASAVMVQKRAETHQYGAIRGPRLQGQPRTCLSRQH